MGSTKIIKRRIFYSLMSHTFAIPTTFPPAKNVKRVLVCAQKKKWLLLIDEMDQTLNY